MKGKKLAIAFLKVLLFLLLLNLISAYVFIDIDMTDDRRYTLSGEAKKAVRSLDGPVLVDVLLAGDLPSEFEKLKLETQQLLEAFAAENRQITVQFTDPLQDEGETAENLANLQRLGITPANITTGEAGRVSQELVVPWALVTRNNKTFSVPLLRNTLGATMEERVTASVQNLEYAFADAFTKLGIQEKKQVAVIRGNGELPDIYLADFLRSIRDYYNIGVITLDSVAADPGEVLDQLNGFDLALIAKPTEPFTDAEKYVLDQFIVGGGKSIWLLDRVAIELDSLFNESGAAPAVARDLNLDDLLFRYGVRINPVLVNDLYFTQIVLATGEGAGSQYNPVPWYYNPMVFSRDNHPLNKNLEALRLQFANTLDTLPNPYRKTILYWSSPLSKADGVPRQISLDMITTPPDRASYSGGNLPLAVLIEGEFSSSFANRLKPFPVPNARVKGPENAMLVVADGDVVKNQLRNGRPLELGYDKWTNNAYGNKEFLLNSINYMLGHTGLINIRNKEVGIPLLDPDKMASHKTKWQLVNIGLPLLLTLVFGLVFNYLRHKKYGR